MTLHDCMLMVQGVPQFLWELGVLVKFQPKYYKYKDLILSFLKRVLFLKLRHTVVFLSQRCHRPWVLCRRRLQRRRRRGLRDLCWDREMQQGFNRVSSTSAGGKSQQPQTKKGF